MKKLLVTLAAVLVSVSSFGQGQIVFNNRNLTAPDGSLYNAPITGDTVGGTAQLMLSSGGSLTPLLPINTFRAAPNNQFLTGPVTVDVTGQPPGTKNLTFVVQAWKGAASYEAAKTTAGASLGQSAPFTVAGALGGLDPAGGPPFIAPDVSGLQGFAIAPVPEPSTIALGILGAAALFIRRRK